MKNLLFVLFIIISLSVKSQEIFSVADIFTNHMVLQRNSKTKIWGTGKAKTFVEIKFAGQNYRTIINKDGKWKLELNLKGHGGPYRLEILNEDKTLCFDDVYIGDVWLAGGQSNMEFPLRRVKNSHIEIEKANFPMIRYYKVPRKFYKDHNVSKENWRVCSKETASEMSAIAYYFSKNLFTELDIPIGIIQVPVGGTTAEAWISRKTLDSDKEFRPIIQNYDSIVSSYSDGEYIKLYNQYNKLLDEYNQLEPEKKKYISKPVEPMGEWNFRRPSGVFETMLLSVAPYTLKGFIFYQGESNTARCAQYQRLFPTLIKEWRKCWGQGDLPFLFVQLPKFATQSRYWNELREAQYKTSMNVKNTGMAVSFDQGNPKDIHPIVKDTVAWRLSQLALGKVYNKLEIYQGPEFCKILDFEKNGLLLEFDKVGSGISSNDGSNNLLGFSIAGNDSLFYPAQAHIVDKNKVYVFNSNVLNPKYVRYLWTNTGSSNFINKEGFPAVPFRSDKFKLKTENVYVNPKVSLPSLDLYLFIGQSNMAGRGYIADHYKDVLKKVWILNPLGEMEPARNPLNKYSTIRKGIEMQGVGPAYSFAKYITKETGRNIGIVVNARGGSSINSWLKGAKDNYYGETLSRIKKAMKYGTLKAVIWHQGESDSGNPEEYIIRLQRLITDLRKDLGNENLPFIVGELAEWRANGTSETFNKMLQTVKNNIPFTDCVSSSELVPLINEKDPHFSADSQIILGRRYAKKICEMCY